MVVPPPEELLQCIALYVCAVECRENRRSTGAEVRQLETGEIKPWGTPLLQRSPDELGEY